MGIPIAIVGNVMFMYKFLNVQGMSIDFRRCKTDELNNELKNGLRFKGPKLDLFVVKFF